MLLITWTSLMTKTAYCFQASFHLMERFKSTINVIFIIIGIIGAIYWLWRQTQYNNQAEQQGTIK